MADLGSGDVGQRFGGGVGGGFEEAAGVDVVLAEKVGGRRRASWWSRVATTRVRIAAEGSPGSMRVARGAGPAGRRRGGRCGRGAGRRAGAG